MHHAICCSARGSILCCQMSLLYRVTWFAVGLLLGPFITLTAVVPVIELSVGQGPIISLNQPFTMQSAPIRQFPTFIALVTIAVNIVGWLLVITNALSRRRVIIDLVHDTINLSSGIVIPSNEIIPRTDVLALSVSKQMVNTSPSGSSSRQMVPVYLVTAALRDSNSRCLVRTVDESIAQTIVQWWNDDKK